MLKARSAGATEFAAAASVTKIRCNAGGEPGTLPLIGAFGFVFGDGGSKEGQRNARSIRSCVPGRRWTGTRMAAGGMLNVIPATATGMAGAVGSTGGPGHRGQST